MRLDGRDLQSLYRCHVTAHVMLPSFPLMSTGQGLLSCKSKQPLVVVYRYRSACKRLQAPAGAETSGGRRYSGILALLIADPPPHKISLEQRLGI